MPVVLAALEAIFGPADGFADARVAGETDTLGIGAAVECGGLGGDGGLMLEVAQADQLQPARPEREFIVAVEVDHVAILDLRRLARTVVAVGPHAALKRVARVPIGAVTKRQVGDRRSGRVELESGGHLGLVEIAGHPLVAGFDWVAERVGDVNRAAKGAAIGAIVDAQRVIDRADLVRIAGRPAKPIGMGVMGSELGPPFELAAAFCAGLDDDVGDLARQAGDAEARSVGDLDPLDVGGRHLLQLVDRAARFVGDALSVDQHILRRLAKPALLVGRLDGEAGDVDQHVIGGGWREAGEVGGREDFAGAR